MCYSLCKSDGILFGSKYNCGTISLQIATVPPCHAQNVVTMTLSVIKGGQYKCPSIFNFDSTNYSKTVPCTQKAIYSFRPWGRYIFKNMLHGIVPVDGNFSTLLFTKLENNMLLLVLLFLLMMLLLYCRCRRRRRPAVVDDDHDDRDRNDHDHVFMIMIHSAAYFLRGFYHVCKPQGPISMTRLDKERLGLDMEI